MRARADLVGVAGRRPPPLFLWIRPPADPKGYPLCSKSRYTFLADRTLNFLRRLQCQYFLNLMGKLAPKKKTILKTKFSKKSFKTHFLASGANNLANTEPFSALVLRAWKIKLVNRKKSRQNLEKYEKTFQIKTPYPIHFQNTQFYQTGAVWIRNKLSFNTEAKLHFAYTSKNMTDKATGKNWMRKTSILQNFLSDARQLWRFSNTNQFEKTKKFTN